MTAPAREFRVTWQRQGMSRPRERLYQSERGARRHALLLQGRIAEATGLLPEDGCPHCDYMRSVEECSESDHLRFPPLILGPRIESRPVGEWTTVSEADPEDREPWPEVDGLVVHPDDLAKREREAALEPDYEASYEIPF